MTDDERRALAERVRAAAKELEQASSAADEAGLMVDIEISTLDLIKLFHGREGRVHKITVTVSQEI